MTDYKKYINALRKCAKEHEGDKTFTGHIIVSDLCQDTANLLEELEQEPILDKKMVDGLDAVAILEEATNGDIIKSIFPNGKYGTNGNFVHVYIPFGSIIQTMTFDLSWWNAPYKENCEMKQGLAYADQESIMPAT